MSIANEVKERPILFKVPMVKAILEGRKTQTRRIVDLSPEKVLSAGQRKIGWTCNPDFARVGDIGKVVASLAGKRRDVVSQQISVPARHPDEKFPWEECGYERLYCPYGDPGDHLWVREAWAAFKPDQQRFGGKSSLAGAMMRIVERKPVQGESVIDYRADKEKTGSSFWRPSIHMPRWASRLTLEITGIRVERLQIISEDDAIAEGNPTYDSKTEAKFCIPGPVYRFEHLWKSINGDHSWNTNPWVWVIEFKRINKVSNER